MKILRGFFCSSLLLGIALLTSASSIIPRKTNEESLKSALDAVTRKQRSLDFSPHDYYNDLRNFKYHPSNDDNEEQFARQRNQDLDDNDEDLEFLSLGNGQLENIGGGYQNFNNKRLERALMDYFENSPGQRETAPSSSSLFRERERNGGNKRALLTNDRLISNVDSDKDLEALLYKELQKGPLYSSNDIASVDNQDYRLSETLQSYYDRYLAQQSKIDRNKLYGANNDPMSWGEIFSKQESLGNHGGKNIVDSINNGDRDEDDDDDEEDNDEDDESFVNGDYGNRQNVQDSFYMLPAERRNVNGRYPIGREYGALLKRYPLTKRSARPLHHDKEPSGVITDPKVAKDLGPLFGSQSRNIVSANNLTDVKILSSVKNDDSNNNHEKIDHGHDRNNHNNHDHENNDHGHDHNNDNDHVHDHDNLGHDREHLGHDHEHLGHDHDYSGHDHDHTGHNRDRSDQDRDQSTVSTSQRDLEVTTSTENSGIMLKSSRSTIGQKEITNSNGSNNPSGKNSRTSKLLSKRDHRNVELRKKSVDWSQYFGIDKRKKKSALLARPDSHDQDDEWMLQRYYNTMAENLKLPAINSETRMEIKDSSEKRDKLDRMDERLKNVKNLIIEDAIKYGNEENSESQEIKDVVMARLAAAYSLEKMRRALNEFRSNIAAQRELMRAANANNNETKNIHDSTIDDKNLKQNEKRNGHGNNDDPANLYEGRNYEGFDEGRGCPALDAIVHRCPHIRGKLSGVRELCIMHQMCLSCDNEEEDCTSMFAFGVDKICETIAIDPRKCVGILSSYWAREPSSMVVSSCHSGPDSCLRRTYRYRHRGIYYQNNGWPFRLAPDSSQLAER